MRVAARELHHERHEYMLKFLLLGDSDVGKDEIANFLEPTVSNNPDALFIRNSSFHLLSCINLY